MRMFIKIALSICVTVLSVSANAQYTLAWDEHQYLPIPDPPFNGYVENALWNTSESNLSFKDADEAGAIIYPNHYFEGTAVVTCDYRYEYYRNGRYQTGWASESYFIDFKSVKVNLDQTDICLNIGESATVKASFPNNTHIPSGAKMTWKTEDDNITIKASSHYPYTSATIKAESSGSATVIFDPIIGPTQRCNVQVNYIEPVKISFKDSPVYVTIGKTKSLSLSYEPENASAKSLSWSSESDEIATVSSKGVVKGISEGMTYINVETDNGLTARVPLYVLPLPTQVYIPDIARLYVGYACTLEPTFMPENSVSSCRWTCDDSTVAKVTSDGVVRGVGKGSAVITVKTENGVEGKARVNVSEAPFELDYRNVQHRINVIENLVKKTLKSK